MIWKVHIGTIFPDLFPGTLGVSCIKKHRGISWDLITYDLRKYGTKGRIDDAPFGGGGGMIIKCEVIDNWIKEGGLSEYKKIYMSPRGKIFNQTIVEEFTMQDIVILCGRYEGVDQRVLDHWNFEEVSIGDFILHGGEVAAMVILECCLRKYAVKNYEMLDSFSSDNLLEHNQYTRPAIWKTEYRGDNFFYKVPEILLSGDHKKINDWKMQNSAFVTTTKRPDLIEKKNRS